MKKKAGMKEPSSSIDTMLQQIAEPMPSPRQGLSKDELKGLIAKVGGPRSARGILNARKSFPQSRIPWLFSSLDTQAVVDLLHHADAILAELGSV